MRIKKLKLNFLNEPENYNLESLKNLPPKIQFPISHLHREHIRVKEGDDVKPGTILADYNDAYIHSSINGEISEICHDFIHIKGNDKSPLNIEKLDLSDNDIFSNFPSFLKKIGLVGMGGSMFPSSIKFKAAKDIHTLIINGTECEPGINIDSSVLLNQSEYVIKGAQTSKKALNAENIILCLKSNEPNLEKFKELYPFKITCMPSNYPAGSEKLILKELLGKLIPAGSFPVNFGYMVQNVCSLRAIGRAIIDEIPVIERPLTIHIPEKGILKNIIAPVGIQIAPLLKYAGYDFAPEKDALINGGLMMGVLTKLKAPVTKGTISLFVLSKHISNFKERDCIRCGTCIDACPLNIHPINIVERLKFNSKISKNTNIQLKECFLCGMCSFNCPAYIPLAGYLKEGKKTHAG